MFKNPVIAQDYINAWTDMNVDQIMGIFTEDAFYSHIAIGSSLE
jgi:hypothetical protein